MVEYVACMGIMKYITVLDGKLRWYLQQSLLSKWHPIHRVHDTPFVLRCDTNPAVGKTVAEYTDKLTFSVREKVNFSLYLINWALSHEGAWGSGCRNPHFLDLCASWRWVTSFTPEEIVPSTHRIAGVVGPRWEEKILDATGTRTLNPLSSSQ
jgi:hypothetical protein